MILEEIKSIRSGIKDLRNFGLVVGIVLILIGFLIVYRGNQVGYLLSATGLFLVVAGLVISQVLRPAHKIWMSIAIILGAVVTRVILTVFFFLGITFTAFIARVVKKKFLDVTYSKGIPSYWKKKEQIKRKPSDWAKQF